MQYEETLTIFFLELKGHRAVLTQTWLLQVGVTPHTTNLLIQCLKQKFGDHLICDVLCSCGPLGALT